MLVQVAAPLQRNSTAKGCPLSSPLALALFTVGSVHPVTGACPSFSVSLAPLEAEIQAQQECLKPESRVLQFTIFLPREAPSDYFLLSLRMKTGKSPCQSLRVSTSPCREGGHPAPCSVHHVLLSVTVSAPASPACLSSNQPPAARRVSLVHPCLLWGSCSASGSLCQIWVSGTDFLLSHMN